MQVEQRKLREGAAAMAAELVSLRHHMALLTSPGPGPTPNGMPPCRGTPNGTGPPSPHMGLDPGDLLSAATSGSLGIPKVPPCLLVQCTLKTHFWWWAGYGNVQQLPGSKQGIVHLTHQYYQDRKRPSCHFHL